MIRFLCTLCIIMTGLAADARAQSLASLDSIKQAMLVERGRIFRDPNSIREAKIGQPYRCPTGGETCVCIEANGKNAFGGYSGIQTIGLVFTPPNRFFVLSRPYPGCGNLLPFPELNGH